MSHPPFSKTTALLFGLIIVFAFSGLIFAWTDPSTSAPGGNIAPPINISPSNQTKSGNLSVGTGLSYWITKSGDSFALNNNAGATKLVIGQDGNVGIGTAGPAGKLHVAIDSGGLSQYITTATNDYAAINIGNNYGGAVKWASFGIRTDGSLALGLGSIASPKMVIDTSGNVGIGTTTPLGVLHIKSTSNPNLRLENSAGGTMFQFSDGVDYASYLGIDATNHYLGFGSPSITDMVIKAGNVGIGTASPGAKLDVQGQIIGGFGAVETGGVLNWDDSTNSRPGSGYTLLLGNATNGPGPASYFHAFNFEYSSKNGTGNITQLAIPYATPSNAGIYIRGRYQGAWSSWSQIGGGTPSQWTTSGSNIYYNSGNVGIGTASPDNKLDVNGILEVGSGARGAQLISTAPDNFILMSQTNTPNTNWNIGSGNGAGSLDTAKPYITSNGYISLMSGNVGIGTTSPSYRLDLGSGTFGFGNGNQRTETRIDAGLQGDAGAQSGFFETSSPTNYPSGASGWWHLIDTRHSNTSNNYALQIAGSFFDQNLYFRKTNNSASAAWAQIVNINSAGNVALPGSGIWNSSGNVGIGTTGPTDKLDIRGITDLRGMKLYYDAWDNSGQGDGGAKIVNDNGNYKALMIVGSDQSQGYARWVRIWDSLWVSSRIDAPAFYYTSDASLKKDIEPINNSLSKISELNGVYFKWKSDDKPSIGLIAQDVEKVFPEAVSTNSDTGLKSVDYGKLVAPLIEAVKAQQAKIDVLETSGAIQQKQIDNLETEIKELKSQDSEADQSIDQ